MQACPQNTNSSDLKSELLELERRFDQCLSGYTPESSSVNELEVLLDRLCHVASSQEYHHKYSQKWQVENKKLLDSVQKKALEGFNIVEKINNRNIYKNPQSLGCYLNEVKKIIVQQTSELNISPQSRVLFIGCGAQPLSCYFLHDHYQCKVVGIDCDPEAIEIAQKHSWYEPNGQSFSLHHACGETFQAKEYTHIFIASLVPNKEEILDHLHSVISDQCKVIVRFGNGLQKLINHPFSLKGHEKWQQMWCSGNDNSLYQAIGLKKR